MVVEERQKKRAALEAAMGYAAAPEPDIAELDAHGAGEGKGEDGEKEEEAAIVVLPTEQELRTARAVDAPTMAELVKKSLLFIGKQVV